MRRTAEGVSLVNIKALCHRDYFCIVPVPARQSLDRSVLDILLRDRERELDVFEVGHGVRWCRGALGCGRLS